MRRYRPEPIMLLWEHPDKTGDVVFNVYLIDEINGQTTQVANQARDSVVGEGFSIPVQFRKAGQYRLEVEAYDKVANVFSERVRTESFLWGDYLAPPLNLQIVQAGA